MDGILVVDKPKGPTSHDVVQYFKRTLPVKKVGHAGTLDPLATGVLIILLDRATKLQSVFMGKDKEYEFTLKLGVATDTYDSEGKITSEKEVLPEVTNRLVEILPRFRGPLFQKPPPFSAIKQKGVPLYKLARRGLTVEVKPRAVQIYSLDILRLESPFVTLKAKVSCGTYVRSLAHDIGDALGVGAHVTKLRRLRSEPFGIFDAISIPDFH